VLKQKLMIVGVSACAILAACSTVPPAALQQAKQNYAQASQDPLLSSQAPVPLYEASQALSRAERAWDKDRDVDEVQHLTYVTDRKIEIARAEAQRKTAEAEARDLRQQAQQLAGARAREAEQANRVAEQRATEAQIAWAQEQARARQAEQAQAEAEQARQNEQSALARTQQLEQQLVDLKARQTERGLELTLSDVLFEFDKANLTPGALRSLAPLVAFLRENPDRTISIEGHTDSLGSDSYNLELSQRRAETIRDFLVQNGISSDRITARGMGKSYPVASNATEAGRQQNRRVEIVIANQEQRAAQQQR
jgi:outer membrane protein OmpA-like peptidoglycan-associated protein